MHTKQVLELVVLEQFLMILPKEVQFWVREHHPQNGEEVVTVLEDLEKKPDEPGLQVPNCAYGQEVLSKEIAQKIQKLWHGQLQTMETQIKFNYTKSKLIPEQKYSEDI
ncbi:zinc finger and SCAN domain-containing protein 23-like isoform 2-T4 [Sarcophilus harrisii]